jgi:hypothetical protein
MAFTYKLETADGLPVDPATFKTIAPQWRTGDVIPLGRRTLRVVGVRDGEPDEPPVLVVEEVPAARLSPRQTACFGASAVPD